jgi:hypothetical protein
VLAREKCTRQLVHILHDGIGEKGRSDQSSQLPRDQHI